MQTKEIKKKDFGYINGWSVIPDEVQQCMTLMHTKHFLLIRKHVTEVSCDICKFKYKIDSSD